MSEVKKLRRRDEIPESDKWRIDKIYEFLLLNEKLSRKLGKLYVYAHMRSHEDTSNPEMQSLVNKIDPYSAEFSSYTAYFVPEILSLKEGTIENFINEDKDLKQYKIYFEMILNEKPHILSKEVESVLASVSDCLGAPESIYSMLTNSDMTFGEIVDESGRKVELTEGNYISFIKSKDRKVREAAFKLLFGTYKKYENTLATSLTSSIKNFVFESKTRKYNSSLEASLKPNNIPVEVYYNALKTVDENMDALHRYVRIKKKLLDIRENVRGAIKTTDKDIAKTALLAKGLREAGQTAASAFRTFADKPEVDYSQKEQKHPITKAVLAPMKAVKKMLVSIELHLDASIDKLDNLAMNVQLDKEKHMENAKLQEQTEPERAEAERVEAEIVYSPMVAEPQAYQYNADAFEARGVDEVKQEAAHKEVSKVREDKAR